LKVNPLVSPIEQVKQPSPSVNPINQVKNLSEGILLFGK
jgi:hypothetical protein